MPVPPRDRFSDINDEPHLRRPVAADPDQSNRLDEEPVRATAVPDADAEMSVADEPAIAWRGVDRARTPGYREYAASRGQTWKRA